METFNINTEWSAAEERMVVTLAIGGQTFIEKFTRSQWRKFVARLHADPLRIAGVTMTFRGDPKRSTQTAERIRQYLRQVDAAFRATGSTTRI